MKKKKSKCCWADVELGGIGDFHDKDKVETRCYICTACKKPCDLRDKKKCQSPNMTR